MTTTKITPTGNPTRLLARIVAIGLLSVSPALLASCQKKTQPMPDKATVESRIDKLESKEQISSILLDFARATDSGNAALLAGLGPDLEATFTLDITDFEGTKHHFDGVQGLVQGFGPYVLALDPRLVAGPIDVEFDGDNATAFYEFVSSVKAAPDLGLEPEARLLIMVSNTATFVRDEDRRWKMRSLNMTKSLAYPGKL
jgi:hypothetical protein